jgi:hypothetical protein
MVIAALVFEAGVCRDDPNRLLTYPLRQLLFWYDLCVAWRTAMNKETEKLQRQERQSVATVSRPFSR